MHLTRTPAALLTLVGLTALLPAAPAHAWGFTDPAVLAPAGAEVSLSSDAAGNAAAAWVTGGSVQVSRRAAGTNAWTAPSVVSAAGTVAASPDVSLGAGGDLAVVWSGSPPGSTPNIEIALQPQGQAWLPPRAVSASPGWTDSAPQVEVGAAGVATIVWSARSASSVAVRAKTASASAVSAATLLASGTGDYSAVSLARSGNGDVVAAWRAVDLGTGVASVMTSRRAQGAAWQAVAETVPTPGVVPDAPSVAMDAAGGALIGFAAGASADSAAPYVVRWPKSAALGAPAALAGLGRNVTVAANPANPAAAGAAWVAPDGVIYADLGPSGAGPARLGPAGSGAPAVSISDTGAVSMSVQSSAGLSLSHLPAGAGAAWATQTVATGPTGRAVATGHGDAATVAWTAGEGGAVLARTLDVAAPRAVHLTAPLRTWTDQTSIKVGWIGADTWSPITYEVQRRVGTWRTPLAAAVPWLTTTDTGAAYRARPGQTVCFDVRGRDQAGNLSAWSSRRCTTAPLDDRSLKPTAASRRSWDRRRAAGYYGGGYLRSDTLGATLSLGKVRARRLGLVVGTGPGFGSVTVRLGKKKLGTYSLDRPRAGAGVLISVSDTQRSGRLTVTVATRGRPVRVDGLLVVSPG